MSLRVTSECITHVDCGLSTFDSVVTNTYCIVEMEKKSRIEECLGIALLGRSRNV